MRLEARLRALSAQPALLMQLGWKGKQEAISEAWLPSAAEPSGFTLLQMAKQSPLTSTEEGQVLQALLVPFNLQTKQR